jgi:hypothetical protein
LRHLLPYTRGIILLTRVGRPWQIPGQARHQAGERQQVLDEKQGAASPHGNVKGRRHHVGPLRRHGADNVIVDAQQQSLAGSIVTLADAYKKPAGERVEGVGYADKLGRGSGKVCIPS